MDDLILGQAIRISTDDTVTVEPIATSECEQHMDDIFDAITDPNRSLLEINRLIALEMARVNRDIGTIRKDPTTAYQLGPLREQVKALRELARTLFEGEELNKKDILNFDGPKFQYVLQQIVLMFKKSMEDAGMDSITTNNILRIYKDKLAGSEADLRKDVAKIESSVLLPS